MEDCFPDEGDIQEADMRRFGAIGVLFGILLGVSPQAHAGLYERIIANEFTYLEFGNEEPAQPFDNVWKFLKNPDRKRHLLDPRIDPIVLLRTVFVSTFEDQVAYTTAEGNPLALDSASTDPSLLGHRQGWILENVEVGVEGRLNQTGIYYRVKFDLVPREKDGSQSDDYLKDAYAGWDLFKFIDLRVGRMKVPFGQANMREIEDKYLIYSPLLDVLIPKRQLGASIALMDPWGILKIQGGFFNSVSMATEQIQSNDQLLKVGRLELNIANGLKLLGLRPWDLELSAGVNIAQVEANYDLPSEHRWMGVDAHFHLALITLEFEYVVKDFDSNPLEDGSQKSLQGWGWHVDAILHAWPGVVDLVFRYEKMDGNDQYEGGNNPLTLFGSDELLLQKRSWITGGVQFHITDQARFDFNYIYRDEQEGFRFDNDVVMFMFQYEL